MPTRRPTPISLTNFYRHPVAMVSTELLVTIVFVILLAVFAIQPTLKTMSELSKEIEEKTELNEKLQQKVAALNSAQAEYYRWQDQLALLETAIPNNQKALLDIKLFEKLAVEANVAITKLTIVEYPDATKPVSTSPKVKEMAVSITVQGDYPSIKQYANLLLNSRRVYVVNSINFVVSTTRDGQQSLAATLTVNAPYYQ